ncbi:MAG: hypothetical protein PHH06_00345 [Candidatus Gracilibacteria bacterium]|nr:hypothetical protein [Candidatus Gracilibacteria bacterium]
MNITPFIGTLIGNIVVAIGIIGVVLIVRFIKDRFLNYINFITAITVGLLLGIIFLGFLPEIVDEGLAGKNIGFFILIGIFLFYALELFLHWHHCKDLNQEDISHSHVHHEHKSGILMFGGTLLHNAFHGVVLFSAFSISFTFGVATTLAILLHSIPQNIVNYIMNHNNTKYAYFAAFGGIFGALLTYPFANYLVEHEAYVLAIIAGGLLYTALADIFPEFKGKGTTINKFSYFVFILVGIILFLGFEKISGGDEHSNETEISAEHECEEHGGKWLEGYKFNECGGVSKEICEKIGGNFNECASACRNNPEAEVCTLQCVQVCEFNK